MQISRWTLPVALVALLCGCSTPLPTPNSESKDHAYIEYWPQAPNAGALRLAVKDLIDLRGVVTTGGTEFLAKHSPPATRDARCMAIARERNVQIVGKTNLTEFAFGVSGVNAYFGTPRNRMSTKYRLIPGGSSSGSAVAVANDTADVAFGTDTAGSIRVPAACCGVWGLKTTFGLVSLDGVYPIAPNHLDTVGPMAKDLPRLVGGMGLLQREFPGLYAAAKSAHPSARGIRIGRLYVDGTDPKIDAAIDEVLKAKGFRVVVMNAEFKSQWEQAESDGRTVAIASGWLSDAKFRNEEGITSKTKAAIAVGELEYRLNYPAAIARKAAWQRTLRRAFQKVDFIALPTLKMLPPRVPFLGGSAAFEGLVLNGQNTVAVNFAGNPALAVPIPVEDKHIPLTSLQLIGPRLSEAGLLNVGRLLERK